MVLPILSIFMFSRYSPLRVNDPKVKLGYLFGSFFIISKDVYKKVGTHESVKSEIVEDGALGKKIKECGYRLKMFRGEDYPKCVLGKRFSYALEFLKKTNNPDILYRQKKFNFAYNRCFFVDGFSVCDFNLFSYQCCTGKQCP